MTSVIKTLFCGLCAAVVMGVVGCQAIDEDGRQMSQEPGLLSPDVHGLLIRNATIVDGTGPQLTR